MEPERKFRPGDRVMLHHDESSFWNGQTAVVVGYRKYDKNIVRMVMDSTGREEGFFEYRLVLIEKAAVSDIEESALEEVWSFA